MIKKDTMELITLVAQAAKGYVAATADGKIDLGDTVQLVSLWPAIVPAISGIAKVPGELADMTPDERTELNTAVAVAISFGGDHKELEGFIEALLVVINSGFALLKAGRELFGK